MCKTCCKCGVEKVLNTENFLFNSHNKRFQSLCRLCSKEYQKEHYKKNKTDYLIKQKERRRKWWLWWKEYRASLKCDSCEENHPACLDFHHRDPTEKDENISHAVHIGWSKKRILAEIAKCDVLCSNCHRKLHWHCGDID